MMATDGYTRRIKLSAWLLIIQFLLFPMLVSLHSHGHHPYAHSGKNEHIGHDQHGSLQDDCAICHLLSQQSLNYPPQESQQLHVVLDAVEMRFFLQTDDSSFFQFHLFPLANSPPHSFS